MFSIPIDYGPGSVIQNENRPVFSKSNHLQKGSALVPKKKALGDISNTLLRKRFGTPHQKKPQIYVPPRKEKVYQEPAGKSQLTFKIASDEPDWDMCSCDHVQEDTYTDIRPPSDHLTDADIVTLLRGMYGMLDSPPLEPDPALKPDYDDVNDFSDGLDWIEPGVFKDNNDGYEDVYSDSDSDRESR